MFNQAEHQIRLGFHVLDAQGSGTMKAEGKERDDER